MEKNSLKQGQGIFYGWVVLAAAFIILILSYAIRNTFSVFYPVIVEEFGWQRGSTALMFSINIMVYGFAAPVAGSLVDRFRPRLVLSVGACILGAGITLCSLATTQWQFYLFYGVVAAIGMSLVGWTPLMTILANWFVKKRGLVFGILGAGFGSSLISASVAQFLISSFGWQTTYVIIGAVAIAIIVPLCTFLISRSPREKGLLPDGMPQKSAEPQDLGQPGIIAGSEEKRATTNLTLSQALKTYQFWLLFLIAFCLFGLAEQIVIAHLVYFFRDIGYQPMTAATIYSVFGVLYVLGTLCSYFSDRLGRERVFIPSCLLSAGAVSLLFLMRDTSQPWMPFLFAICFGLGLGAAGPVFFSTVADLFQGKYFGSILGTITLGFSLGGAIAPWLAGFLHDRTNSYFATFVILSASLIACVVLMWLVAPSKIRPISGRA